MLCCGALLLACGSPAPRSSAPTAAVSPADDWYLRGRNLHLERRYGEAVAAYQAALKADPAHVNAQNGLAIAYAERREFDKAIPIWRGLTRGATMASGTGTAFLFANLGYAYFLQGDYDEAVVALEKACLLDPLNARAWQNLGEALQRLGQDERAQQMLRQAAALRDHDLRADYAAAHGGARMPAIEQAVQAARRPDRDWAFVDIVNKGNGLVELRRVAAAPAALPAALPTVAAPAVPASAERATPLAALEISNGNGREGLARLVARQLREPGLKVVRVRNEKGFGVRQTRIEYRPAFHTLADRLAERLGAGKAVEAKQSGRADVRLVIGHDLTPQTVAQRLSASPASPDNAPTLTAAVTVSQQ
jgi:Flp pilus assembly protein TadD